MSVGDAIDERSIEKLIADPEFKRLNRELSESTLFDVLGISFKEFVHSRMLGWLLNPSESHGLSDSFLRAFLAKAAERARDKPVYFDGEGRPTTPLQALAYSFSDLTILPEYTFRNARRPDLVLLSNDDEWLCVIENKILSDEGEEQTTDYYQQAQSDFPTSDYKSRLFIYLSPKGTEPASKYFVRMGYKDVTEILAGLDSPSSFGSIAIGQYRKCLERRVVDPEELKTICWQLYRQHSLAIDMISLHGNVNLLATRTAEFVLQDLRDELKSPVSDRDWQSPPPQGNVWIAIRPKAWPQKWKTGYPGSYEILFKKSPNGSQGTAESINVGIVFGVTRVGELLKELLPQEKAWMLDRKEFKSESLNDLSEKAVAASRRLVDVVTGSLGYLEDALRKWESESSGS
jgi:hypothetical protein